MPFFSEPSAGQAHLPNGDLAGGQTILGLRSGLKLYANVRPVKLYPGVMHKVHGVHKQVWEPDLVDLVMIRENTEGLYHSLLRRMEQKATGGKDERIVIDEFPGIEGGRMGSEADFTQGQRARHQVRFQLRATSREEARYSAVSDLRRQVERDARMQIVQEDFR